MDLWFDPVNGEGDQAHTHFRVKTAHCFHQADVTFLNQIRLAGDSPHNYEQYEQQTAGETGSAF